MIQTHHTLVALSPSAALRWPWSGPRSGAKPFPRLLSFAPSPMASPLSPPRFLPLLLSLLLGGLLLLARPVPVAAAMD